MGTLFKTSGAVSSQQHSAGAVPTSTEILIIMADAAEEAKQKEALNGQLKEYIAEWRKTREKEEEELKKLKEKQAKRKEIRAEQVKKLKLQGKKCLKPRRLELEQTRRSLLLVEPVVMPAEKRQRPRNSLKKRRRLPLASD